MTKIPMYIKYIEKEYDIEVLEQTKKKTGRLLVIMQPDVNI